MKREVTNTNPNITSWEERHNMKCLMRKRIASYTTMCVVLLMTLVSLAPGTGAWVVPAQSISQPGESATPAIAAGDQYVHAVWATLDTVTGTHNIYYNRRHIDLTLWENPRPIVSTATAGDSITPDIAVYGSDVFVVWCDNTMTGTNQFGYYDVYIAVHHDNGADDDGWSLPVDISFDVLADAHDPSVAAIDSTAYVVFSEDMGSHTVIYFRKWHEHDPLPPRIGLTNYPSGKPDVSLWRTGVSINVVAAWEGFTTPHPWEIRSRRSTSDGELGSWYLETMVSTGDSYESVSPSIDYNRGIVHATWIDHRMGEQYVYYTRSTDQGASWEPNRRISPSTTFYALTSSVASIGLCVGVVWNEWSGTDARLDDTMFRRSCDSGITWESPETLEGVSPDSLRAQIAADKRLHWDLDLYGDFHVVFEVAGITPSPNIYSTWVDTNEYVYRSGLPSFFDRKATSAVWRGGDPSLAYIFGGITSVLPWPYLDDIIEYNPDDESFAGTGDRLIRPNLGYTSAVWDPRYTPSSAYIFGGRDETDVSNQILRYTPDTHTIDVMLGHLPIPSYGTSAFRASTYLDGKYAYIFGGIDDNGNYLDEVVRYDIYTDTPLIYGDPLPSARAFTTAVWDELGTYGYIFGGQDETGAGINEVLRFDPLTGTNWPAGSLPPTVEGVEGPRWGISAARFEAMDEIYLFGGTSSAGDFDSILIYDPLTYETTVSCLTLPTKRSFTSAVWDTVHDGADIFGGGIVSIPPTGNQVVRYVPDT